VLWGSATAIAILLLGWLALGRAQAGSTDDLFVVLVYARNLLAEGSFTHQAGGVTLDGFTSLLDLLLKTAALALAGSGDALRAAWTAETLCYLAALALGGIAAVRLSGGRPWLGVLGALALAVAPGLAEGTSYLLETPLFLALLAAAALACAPSAGRGREVALLAIAAALAATRPEGIPLALLLLLLPRWGWRRRWWRTPAAFLLLVVLYLAWRTTLFGSWAPNSYHAKTSDLLTHELSDGLRYVGDFLAGASDAGMRSGPSRLLPLALVGWILIAPLVAAMARREGAPDAGRARARALAWCAPAALAIVVLSGGDPYRGARLLAPALWLGLLGAVALAARARGAWRLFPLATLLVTLAVRTAEVVPGGLARPAPLGERHFALEARALERLEGALPQGALLAMRHLQMAAYFAPELAILDLTGLNDRTIAHSPAPGPVRFGRTSLQPALEARAAALHLHHSPFSDTVLARQSLEGLLAGSPALRATLGDPLPGGDAAARLAEGYRTATLLDAGGGGRHFNLLIRADLTGAVEAAGFLVGPP